MARSARTIAAAAFALLAHSAAAGAAAAAGSRADAFSAQSATAISAAPEAAWGARRLQTTPAYNFATQTEIVLCLKAGVAAPLTTPAQVRTAAVNTLGLSPNVDVQVSQAVDKCTLNQGWQARISVFNTGTANTSAAEVASGQVDSIYFAQAKFFADMSKNMNAAGAADAPAAADLTLETLGYLVVWMDASLQSASGTVSVGGDTAYMPAWVWALLVLLVVFLLVPLAYFCYRRKRDREIEQEDAEFAKAHGLAPLDGSRHTKAMRSDESSPTGLTQATASNSNTLSRTDSSGAGAGSSSRKWLLSRFSNKSLSAHSVADDKSTV